MTTILRARMAHTPRDPFARDDALETFDDGAIAFEDGTIVGSGEHAPSAANSPTPRCSTAATASCCPGSSTRTSTSRRSP